METDYKEYGFIRQKSSGIYYTDIRLSIDSSVKYDIFDDQVPIGTVIDSVNRTFAKLDDGFELHKANKSFHFPQKRHRLKTADGKMYATITAKYRGWTDKPFVEFEDETDRYIIKWIYGGSKTDTDNYDFKAEITVDNNPICIITNYEKGSFFSMEETRFLQGTIKLRKDVKREKLLAFLVLLQLRIGIANM